MNQNFSTYKGLSQSKACMHTALDLIKLRIKSLHIYMLYDLLIGQFSLTHHLHNVPMTLSLTFTDSLSIDTWCWFKVIDKNYLFWLQRHNFIKSLQYLHSQQCHFYQIHVINMSQNLLPHNSGILTKNRNKTSDVKIKHRSDRPVFNREREKTPGWETSHTVSQPTCQLRQNTVSHRHKA